MRRRPLTCLAVELLEGREVPADFTAATVPELVAAIDAANLTPEADTISLAAGSTFTLTAANNATFGRTGLPVVAAGEDLTVLGNGATIERSKAAGTPAFRLIAVAGGASLTLRDLALQRGKALGVGGAVHSAGALTLDRVTVQNNVVQGLSWPDDIDWYVPGGSASGGGVYSTGTLVMTGCIVRNNTAIGGRGADGSAFNNGGAGSSGQFPGAPGGNAYGGGVFVAGGTAVLTGTTITGNSAQGGTGGRGTKGAQNGATGAGVGGGIAIAPAAVVSMDPFTLSHVRQNHASTADNNIAAL